MQALSWNREAKDSKEEEMMHHNFNIPRSEVEKIIEEWVFNVKYRKILKLRFLDGLTYEQIAERMDMSDRQIKRIVYKYGDMALSHVPNRIEKR